jgi:hypothetical protein
MKRLLAWFSDYWWIPALILVGVGVTFFGRRAAEKVFGQSFPEKFDLEMEAIKERRKVREIEQQESHDRAVHYVQEKYALKLAALDTEEKQRARELEGDPKKLAEMMVRLGR